MQTYLKLTLPSFICHSAGTERQHYESIADTPRKQKMKVAEEVYYPI